MERNLQPGFAVWITGLPASGKSTVTAALVRRLHNLGADATVLESDVLRKTFAAEPRYDEQARDCFYGSLAFIGRILTEHGISVIIDATANRRRYRDLARKQIPRLLEIFVDCPLEICIQRDPKGIYRKAKEDQLTHVPGIQAVYEPPAKPDVVIRGDREKPEAAAERVVEVLVEKGFLKTCHAQLLFGE